MGLDSRYIIDFSKIHRADEDLIGKKAYELGMLWKLGIPLQCGFVITAKFQKEFLDATKIDHEIKKTQALYHPAISGSFDKLFASVRKEIIQKPIPQELAMQLHKFYRKLSGIFKGQSLNVFSSGANNKSLAFSNVKGDTNLIFKIKTIWSLFLEEPIAIAVQRNIKGKIKGKIITDSPTIDKKLTKQQMDKLIEYCKIIQKYFYFPKEIEYIASKDKIFITKVNPFTGIVNETLKSAISDNKKQRVLIKGIPVNPGIVTGPVRILRNNYNNLKVKKGEVIVLSDLNKSLFKKIKNAKAVVVDSVLPNSLSKTLFRKNFQIPAVEGAKNATKMFQNGNIITVNGVSGEIYPGGLVY